jgi:hypothetical protein
MPQETHSAPPCQNAWLAAAEQRRSARDDRSGGAIRLEHGCGQPIVAGVIAALRATRIILPVPVVIERTAIAGRARARKRTADALLAGLSPAQLAELDRLLIPDPALEATPFAWLRNASTSPKPDHVRAVLDWLRFVRDIGIPPEAAARIHDDRFQQLVSARARRRPRLLRGRDPDHVGRRNLQFETALDLGERLPGNPRSRARLFVGNQCVWIRH